MNFQRKIILSIIIATASILTILLLTVFILPRFTSFILEKEPTKFQIISISFVAITFILVSFYWLLIERKRTLIRGWIYIPEGTRIEEKKNPILFKIALITEIIVAILTIIFSSYVLIELIKRTI